MYHTDAQQTFIGPAENSLLNSVYQLVQRIKGHSREQRNDQVQFDAKLEEQAKTFKNELSRQKELLRQAEVRCDASKSAEKAANVQF